MNASPVLRPRLAAVAVALAGMLVGACAVDSTAGRPSPTRAVTERVAEIALEMRGQPYRWGGEAPGGFDCSGLVQYAYAQAGVDVPRTTAGQYEAVRRLYLHQLSPGDLIFFRTRGALGATHVGIYVGDERFVHALNQSQPVHAARLDDDYWQRRLVAAGSLLK